MVLPPIFMPTDKKYKILYRHHDFFHYLDTGYRCSNYNGKPPCHSTIKLNFVEGKAKMENQHNEQCKTKVYEQFLQSKLEEMEAVKADNKRLVKKVKSLENEKHLAENEDNLNDALELEGFVAYKSSREKTTLHQSASLPTGLSQSSVAGSSSTNLGLKPAPKMHSYNLAGQNFIMPSDTESAVFLQQRKRPFVQEEVDASMAKCSRVDLPGSSHCFPAPADTKAQNKSPSKKEEPVAEWNFCPICYTFQTIGSAHVCKGQPEEWLQLILQKEAEKQGKGGKQSGTKSGQFPDGGHPPKDGQGSDDGAAGGGGGGMPSFV